MKLMKKKESKITIKVVEHIILKNLWEYYITAEETNDQDTKFALVMGLETELGYVHLPEIQPKIISRTTNLEELAPAIGWEWVEASESQTEENKEEETMSEETTTNEVAETREEKALNAINEIVELVEKDKAEKALEPQPEAPKKPFLIRADEIKIFDEEGRHLKDYKALVREDKHEQLFAIVTKGYKIAQHEDIVDSVEKSLNELGLVYNSKIINMDDGARIRMVTNFPNITINVGKFSYALRLSWDNSYNLTTGVRLLLGALSSRGHELYVEAKYANYYHRHTKGLEIKDLKHTIEKGIEVFKTKVAAEFQKLLDTPMTMDKAINFLDDCIKDSVIAEVYLSALKYELKKIPADELDSQFILFNLINSVLHERVKSLDSREKHIRAMNNRLKSKS